MPSLLTGWRYTPFFKLFSKICTAAEHAARLFLPAPLNIAMEYKINTTPALRNAEKFTPRKKQEYGGKVILR